MPKTLKSQVIATLQLLDGGSWRQAAALAGRILGTYPLYSTAYTLAARAFLGLGSFHTAADLLSRVLSADPQNAEAYMSLGLIAYSGGDAASAEAYLLRAHELAPGDIRVKQALREILPASSWETTVSEVSRPVLAHSYMRAGLYSYALEEWGMLAEQQPQRTELVLAMGEAAWLAGQPELAAAAASRVLAESPWCLKANLLLGKMWLNSAHDEYARACLDLAQAIDPENRWAQALLGQRSPLPPRMAYLDWDAAEENSQFDRDYLNTIDGEETLPELD